MMSESSIEDALRGRFSRQTRLKEIRAEGQRALLRSRVVVVGMGALGAASSQFLLRAGIRRLRLIDRDFVEESNLPRQILYTARHAQEGTPKAVAAAEQLGEIDPEGDFDVHVDDLTAANVDRLLGDSDLIIDGLDNFEGRYLINDYAIAHDIPWVYGGAVGASGLTFPIVPGKTACLRCLFPDLPEAGRADTCETVGVLPTLPALVAALQVTEAIKILVGDNEHLLRQSLAIDMWAGFYRPGPKVQPVEACPCCGKREFPFLEGRSSGHTETLCGRNAVQIQPNLEGAFSLDDLAQKIPEDTIDRKNPWILRFDVDEVKVTVFRDGRAILQGTDDPARARALYARYIGS